MTSLKKGGEKENKNNPQYLPTDSMKNNMNKFIYRPIKFNRITQIFGENKTDYSKLGMLGHNGLDMATWNGTPIYHSGDYMGYMKTEIDAMGGIGVDIYSNTPQIDGKRIKLRYWHLKQVVGWDGKEVRPGQLIGFADNTGFSTGDHLYFDLKCVDENDKTSRTIRKPGRNH
ncbi:MAG: hypothetical protein A2672_00050 [Candidatus Wildermuthbacteria bacterium RIFCSPHIGHO2_01_FULL_49_22b]|uniref:M23ase beta-sheet core domain-containing protein n=1 Tax=Candidatus Wildermuthbacteria bacterium RIFCSPHIGHO2_01_FULL_49_22b TaxID=1802448 RepID=A0A1G2R1M2_9BACT|nr:MAG: hypothetical protein A2672_00050 [Candidatus Wildermuthbacteria bacterium RIFCSPHIGHO2_01_FULL_49_22b]